MTVRAGLGTSRATKAFHLKVLGGLCLTRNARAVTGPAAQRRHRAVLAVLAMHADAGISREKLAALLWPESNEANARNSLKQALHVLRHEITTNVVIGTADLRLNLALVSCDLAEVELLLRENRLEDAAEAYAGPFLDGFHLGGDAAEFEQWVENERSRLERRYATGTEALARRATSAGDQGSALRWWRRLSDLAPLDSRYAERVAATLNALDDRAGALRHIDVHRTALQKEVGLPLGAELEQLMTAIRTAPHVTVHLTAEGPPSPAEFVVGVRAPPISDVSIDRTQPDSAEPSRVAAEGARQSPANTSSAPPEVSIARRLILVACLGAVAVLAATTAWRYSVVKPPPIDARRVAVMTSVRRRDNPYADTLATILSETIARRLTAATAAHVIMLPPVDATDARAASQRSGASLLVLVSFLNKTGPLEVTVSSATTGEQLSNEEIDVVAPRHAERAGADSVAERTATAVAVRLDSNLALWIDGSSRPTSLASYQAAARGLALYADLRSKDAALYFTAAARDTAFTMALVLEAWADYDASQPRVADSIVRSLKPRRLRMLDVAMVNHLSAVLSHDLGAEYQASLAVSAAAPHSEWRYLQAESALKLGRSAETVRVLDEMGPDLGWLKGYSGYWILLERALHYSGKHDRELAVMTVAATRFPTNRILIQGQLKALAALGRVAGVDSTIDYALTLRQKGNWGDIQPMDQTVRELSAHGQKDAAQRLALRTLAWMRVQPPQEQKQWLPAVPEFLYYAGLSDSAQRLLQRLRISEPNDYENLTLLAVICVEHGDRATARTIDLQLASISDPALRADLLMDRASIAASLGDRATAVRMIRDAYRAGFEWRNVIHVLLGFDRIRGYAPFEALIRPVE